MLEFLVKLHEDFFDNDNGNKMTTAIGFAFSAVVMLLVLGLYQL